MCHEPPLPCKKDWEAIRVSARIDIIPVQARIEPTYPPVKGIAAMIISCQLFEAYLFCPLKCWLRSRAEPVTANRYAEWARAHKEAYYNEGLKRAVAVFAESARAINPPITSNNFRDATWRFAIDVRLRTHDL